MAIEVYGPGRVTFVHAVSVRHLDFEPVLHCKVLHFPDQKVSEKVFRQEPVVDLVALRVDTAVHLLRLQVNLVRLRVVEVQTHFLHEFLVGHHDVGLEQFGEELGHGRVDANVARALDELVVLQLLLAHRLLVALQVQAIVELLFLLNVWRVAVHLLVFVVLGELPLVGLPLVLVAVMQRQGFAMVGLVKGNGVLVAVVFLADLLRLSEPLLHLHQLLVDEAAFLAFDVSVKGSLLLLFDDLGCLRRAAGILKRAAFRCEVRSFVAAVFRFVFNAIFIFNLFVAIVIFPGVVVAGLDVLRRDLALVSEIGFLLLAVGRRLAVRRIVAIVRLPWR